MPAEWAERLRQVFSYRRHVCLERVINQWNHSAKSSDTHGSCCCLPGCPSESFSQTEGTRIHKGVPVKNVMIWFLQKVRWNDIMVLPGLKFSDSHRKRLTEHRKRTQCCVSPLLTCVVQIHVLHLRRKNKSVLQNRNSAPGTHFKCWWQDTEDLRQRF